MKFALRGQSKYTAQRISYDVCKWVCSFEAVQSPRPDKSRETRIERNYRAKVYPFPPFSFLAATIQCVAQELPTRPRVFVSELYRALTSPRWANIKRDNKRRVVLNLLDEAKMRLKKCAAGCTESFRPPSRSTPSLRFILHGGHAVSAWKVEQVTAFAAHRARYFSGLCRCVALYFLRPTTSFVPFLRYLTLSLSFPFNLVFFFFDLT